MPCDGTNKDGTKCKRPAIFRTTTPHKYGEKDWCEPHLKDKATRHELTVKRI